MKTLERYNDLVDRARNAKANAEAEEAVKNGTQLVGEPGCKECRTWHKMLAEVGGPVSPDTFCGNCGSSEEEVARWVRRNA